MKEWMLGIFMTTLGVLGIIMMAYTLFYDQEQQRNYQTIQVSNESAARVVVNGDTTRSIYILQDSLSGWVWVAIPGTVSRGK